MKIKIAIIFIACLLLFNCPSARQACCNSSDGGCTYQGWLVFYYHDLIAEKEGKKSATPNFYLLLALEAYNNAQKCQGKTDDFVIDPFN